MLNSNLLSVLPLLGFTISSAFLLEGQGHDAPPTKQKSQMRSFKPLDIRAPSVDGPSKYVFPLKTKARRTPSAADLHTMHVEEAILNTQDTAHMAEITMEGQKFEVMLDTGSSELWVATPNYTCLNSNLEPAPESVCNISQTYIPGPNFKQVPGRELNLTYGSSAISGIYGYSTVEFAGIEVRNQITAFPNRIYHKGNGGSGLLGLGYTAMTGLKPGSTPYDNLLTSMWKEGLVDPTFSLALERNGTGYIALGGLPPVSYKKPFVSTPIEATRILGLEELHVTVPTYCSISVDQVILNGQQAGCNGTNSSNFQVMIDSGTTLNYLPDAIVDEISSQFSPPAVLNNQTGQYIVPCNATAPQVGIKIGGKEFTVNPLDLIRGEEDHCYLGIQKGAGRGTQTPWCLGNLFLRNVLAVFDVGAAEVQLAQRDD